MPDNREMATAILLAGFLIFGLAARKAREQIPSILRSVASVAWLFIVYLTSASLLICAAWSVGLWTPDLSWSTVIVGLGLGVGLVSGAVNARSVRALWDALAGKTLGAAILIGVYVNLATFPLVVEIVFQALATVAVMLKVVADHQDQKPARQLADAVLSVVGLILLSRTTTVLAHGMPESEWLGLLRQALLSIWFPLALVPLLYLVSYLSTVEMAVVGVRIIKPREIRKWPLIWRFLLAFRLRLSLAAAFDRSWGRRYAIADDRRARRATLARYREVERPRFALTKPSVLARLKRVTGRPEGFAWDGRAMPRCSIHLTQMVASKPPGWEPMAFGAHLWIGMAEQRDRYRAHVRRRPVRAAGDKLTPQQSIPHLADLIGTGGPLLASMEEIFSDSRQEAAFGPLGEPGSPVEIRRMADDLIDTHVSLMDWGGGVRGTRVPFRHRGAYRAASRLMDGPVEQVRHFAASLAEQLDAIPEHVASGSNRQLNITLKLTLSIRAKDRARLGRATRRLGRFPTGALPKP